ncbi:reverse transcriptase-like protein [Peribacillus simplex]|uniref:Reverse transcriptase-like protein n=1 Tax=Peribacillus simplex TaxID=1478 RepID=A0A9X8ZF42_9BACI|nr:reverse transcriptase-like protein [Peribacillus simplex]TKH02754.1 reverse transcriptase-like protein [Peribacillus simplex]TKH09379.1 reverse transcriptase-like protein [Peribacillus simplex]
MIEVYIDGASAGNPGPSGAGVFINNNGVVERHSFPLGNMENHEAEYHALIKALEICVANKYQIVSFRTDSQAINQAIEKRFAKNKYAILLEQALKLSDELELFFMKWIPNVENKSADELARRAIRMNKAEEIHEQDS